LKQGFTDSHFICFPYETRRTGIYSAGCVRKPMDLAAAALDGSAAALKAMSSASARLAHHVAQMRPDELDQEWSRREAHPACASLVADWWISVVLSRGGARSVGEIAEACDTLLPAFRAAQDAAHVLGSDLTLSEEAELLRALALVCAEAEVYAAASAARRPRPR